MNLLIAYLKEKFKTDATGHDWHHIERVYRNALFIQEKEGGDQQIIALTSLLHDIDDHKFNGGKLNNGKETAYALLIEFNFDKHIAQKVSELVDEISYKGNGVKDQMSCLESKIVQDADRLDAIGAIGIARAFAYGGNKNRPIYEPEMLPQYFDQFEQYANNKSHTINHFYEKLLLLKDRMHTETGKKLAMERDLFLKQFLTQFEKEWNFNKQDI
jgi:uncharacterized protein